MRELLTVGKLWELAQLDRRTPGADPYDLVVVDAPATGHGVAVLTAPRTFAAAAGSGPVARQGKKIDATLSDPELTAVIAVANAEELAVTETGELRDVAAREHGPRARARDRQRAGPRPLRRRARRAQLERARRAPRRRARAERPPPRAAPARAARAPRRAHRPAARAAGAAPRRPGPRADRRRARAAARPALPAT